MHIHIHIHIHIHVQSCLQHTPAGATLQQPQVVSKQYVRLVSGARFAKETFKKRNV